MFNIRMPRLRFARSHKAPHDADILTLLSAMVDNAEHSEKTTLRDLHRITDLSQVQALKAAREMENRGLIHVEQLSHDRLASGIELTELAYRALAEAEAA